MYKRKINIRKPYEHILIVCEGEITEPNYFNPFKPRPDVIIEVHGEGANTLSLIRRAVSRKKERERFGSRYNQVWCVFDRDSFPREQFKAAYDLARNENIKIAYSNQSFELWYLLHFCYNDAAIARAQYIEKLSGHLGEPYRKNNREMYKKLLTKQSDAIRNAQRLLTCYINPEPERDDPSTTVHKLVMSLNELA